jgi:seryl-tRNA synthetase
MFDLRWIREHPDDFDAGLTKRGLSALSAEVLALDAERRAVLTRLQEAQGRRNELSKHVGKVRAAGEDAVGLMAEVGQLKDVIQDGESRSREIGEAIDALLQGLPNLPADDVPVGEDEGANVEIRRHGEPPAFDFTPKQHFELGEALGEMDFETASRLSGARFVVLCGRLARLERALAQFMLDVHTEEFGYLEVAPPLLVRDHTAFGTGNLPKFEEDLFKTTDGYYLIPTAEMPLTNLVRERILNVSELPKRFTAVTPCFRSEAGAAGKDTRGMIRQHQFTKVELVSVTVPERSEDEHERMTGCAEAILQRLGLPYRVLLLCTGDMGAAARKTYDLEVWLPAQGQYREISSCSNCGDYQARRMDARYRPDGEKGTRFVHTLNGSGLAVGRTLVALLENGQQPDGSVLLPEALHGYMGGLTRIEAA